MQLKPHKKLYFASDFHLGVPSQEESVARERKICAWLDAIRADAQAVFLVGDIFDFWFEYKRTIPKGHIRLQGKLAELSDAGIEIYLFTGNHDMWMQGYFEREIGAKVYRNPIRLEVKNEADLQTSLHIAHGDGLGPGDYGYKFLKRVFESPFCRWAFGWLHPNVGIWLANTWSGSRKNEESLKKTKVFYGDKEWLFQYAQQVETQQHHDYYIFGHRHLVLDMQINENARYVNLGEWFSGIDDCYYAVFDGEGLALRQFS